MNKKTIFYDAVTFRFIRQKERRLLLRKGARRGKRLLAFFKKLVNIGVFYSLVDLVERDPSQYDEVYR